MNGLTGVLKKIYRALPSPPSTNYLYRHFDVNPYQLLPQAAVVFDIGSKDARGNYAFGSPPPDSKVVCVDVEPGPGVDVVADAHDLYMVPSDSVDCVLCIGVVCCTRYPQTVMKEIQRILKPGGIVYVSVPFVFPYCADPDDYYRFSYTGLRILCEEFDRLDSGFNRGPASTMHELFVRFFAMLFSFNNTGLYAMNEYCLKWLLFWIKYMDKFLARYGMAHHIHSGSYFIGRKHREVAGG
jgi:SAM-dependent methyltransferase